MTDKQVAKNLTSAAVVESFGKLSEAFATASRELVRAFEEVDAETPEPPAHPMRTMPSPGGHSRASEGRDQNRSGRRSDARAHAPK